MKSQITKASERGAVEAGWLKARHYFSFGSYFDPNKMGFGKLRVINDDRIAEGSGFGTHSHQNMEIITIPLRSAVLHKDSMGNEGVVTAGEVQVMSAGSGVSHSEHNASNDEELKLFQIWIEPNKMNVEPRYDQKRFELSGNQKWTQLVSPLDEDQEGLKIHQNAFINRGEFETGTDVVYNRKSAKNGIYVLLVSGSIEINEQSLKTRDSMALTDTEQIEIKIKEPADILIIEVPLD
jgi:redox-sensitive bicupin YhaK (pirin superfamily)